MGSGTVRVRVSSEIEIKVDDLDSVFYEQIRSALTFENEEREKALSLRLPGAWELPKTIVMYREERRRGGEHILCLPRGFAALLVLGAQHNGLQIEWDDKRSSIFSKPGYFRPFGLRDYQISAVMQMLMAEQGIYRAPAGSGKTTSMLGLMAHAQQRTLVITDKAFLLEQWRERACQFLGLSLDLDDERSVGKIGEDMWEERDLTIALRQTLFSRLWETKATNILARYGITILDESHHAGSAESLQEVVREIPSKMLFGVSATPSRTPMQGQIVGALIGPIVAETSRQELYDRGILVRPSVRVVDTDFQADFWKDHDSSPNGACDNPSCRKKVPHSHRNNYSSVLKALVNDEERNRLIAREIISERGHVHLVPSRQLNYLNLIKRALEDEGWDGPIYLLRGEENARGESQDIVRAIEAGGVWKIDKKVFKETKERVWMQTEPIGDYGHEAVILSTVADEGMDIPMIDREHIVFPMRQEAALIQLVGRCERKSPLKKDAVVIEYRDPRCTIFAEQASERMRVYRYQSLREEMKV